MVDIGRELSLQNLKLQIMEKPNGKIRIIIRITSNSFRYSQLFFSVVVSADCPVSGSCESFGGQPDFRPSGGYPSDGVHRSIGSRSEFQHDSDGLGYC